MTEAAATYHQPVIPSYTFNQRLLECALERYGQEAQFRQLQEELAELIVAVSHYLRDRCGAIEEVLNEAGDVYLMLGQLRLAMGQCNVNAACAEAEVKLVNRLAREAA